jgi:hypothetical protein
VLVARRGDVMRLAVQIHGDSMGIELIELRRTLVDDFEYPISTANVLQQAGQERIEAPDKSDSETLIDILEPIGEETFGSPEELFEEILGNLDEAYIGRKFYDDRGTNIQEIDYPLPHDELDHSF